MKKLMMLFAAGAAIMMTGCTATKVEYKQNSKGETQYSLWHNDHWMKTSTERLAGGMDKNGRFSVELAGRDSSPSEEFNRTMQTYMNAIVSAMQIAAAAYNPSASAAVKSAAQSANVTTVPAITSNANVATVPAITSNANVATAAAQSSAAAECKDGSCTDKADCKDGSCETSSPARATDDNSDSDTSHREPAGTAGEAEAVNR